MIDPITAEQGANKLRPIAADKPKAMMLLGPALSDSRSRIAQCREII
jgi:hypothetical protein